LDPSLEQADLIGTGFLASLRRRHDLVRVGAAEAADEFTLLGLARHDGQLATLAHAKGTILNIQPKPALTAGRRGPVALVAVLGKDGLDVPGKLDLRRTDRASNQEAHNDPALQQSDGGHGDHDVDCGVLFK
jgi:hypothetical protein